MNRADGDIASRIIRVPAAAPRESEERRAARKGAVALAAALLAALLSFDALGDAAAVTRGALRQFPIWWGGDSEADRVFRTGWPAFAAAREIAESGEKTLVFRQAEVAFYTRAPFVSYFDPTIAPIFAMRTPEEAGAALRSIGVARLAIPDYPMAEVYNSPIGALVASPALARLERDFGGFRVYRLLDAQGDEWPVRAEEGFTSKSAASGLWSSAIGGHGAAMKPARAGDDGWLELETPAGALTNPAATVELVSVPPPGALHAPHAAKTLTDLAARHSVLSLEARLAGWGRAEVVFRTIFADPTTAARDSVVWAGTLTGGARTVSGQFMPQPGGPEAASRNLVVRLKGTGVLRFGGWRLRAPETADAKALPTPATAGDLGWSLLPDDGASTLSLGVQDGAVLVAAGGPRRRVVRGPWLLNRAALDLPPAVLEILADVPASVTASAEMAGAGDAIVETEIVCGTGVRRSTRSANMVLAEAPVPYAETISASCVPIAARMTFLLNLAEGRGASIGAYALAARRVTPAGIVLDPFEAAHRVMAAAADGNEDVDDATAAALAKRPQGK